MTTETSNARGEWLPDRDESKAATEQGLFRKFEVRRTDGSDAPGGKHDGCEYFVLDMTHDPHAKAAAAAYAASVAETHPQLAADMGVRYGITPPPAAARGDERGLVAKWRRESRATNLHPAGCAARRVCAVELESALAAEGVQYSPQAGEPPTWFDEWFIAQTQGGERVVLRRLPKEWAYDYTTADGTYFKADRIRWWMQFPDSQFKPLEAALSQQPEARGVVDVTDAMVARQIIDEFIQCAEAGRPHGKLIAQARDWLALTAAQQLAAVDGVVGRYEDVTPGVAYIRFDNDDAPEWDGKMVLLTLATQHQEPTK